MATLYCEGRITVFPPDPVCPRDGKVRRQVRHPKTRSTGARWRAREMAFASISNRALLLTPVPRVQVYGFLPDPVIPTSFIISLSVHDKLYRGRTVKEIFFKKKRQEKAEEKLIWKKLSVAKSCFINMENPESVRRHRRWHRNRQTAASAREGSEGEKEE